MTKNRRAFCPATPRFWPYRRPPLGLRRRRHGDDGLGGLHDTGRANQTYTYDFVVKGTVLTGTAKGNLLGETVLAEGKAEGDKYSVWWRTRKFMEMPIRIEYTGTVTSDDEIKFTRKVADFATEELVAKRAK